MSRNSTRVTRLLPAMLVVLASACDPAPGTAPTDRAPRPASPGARIAPAPAAPQPPAAVPAPPLAIRGLALASDRWPDLAGPAEFARSVFRLERCRDEQEEAEALFAWMQRLVAVGPPVYEGRAERSYVLDAGRILRVHGYSTCDGIGTGLAQLWRALGREAHKTYLPARGHTVAELEYRDRDGQVRWHLFDAHGGWYALMPDGRVAGAADVARHPELVPLRGAWSGYCTIATVHPMSMPGSPWDSSLALHPGESVELLWDGGGRCYYRPETLTSDFRKEFFKEGSPYRRQVGAAHFVYEPDFAAAPPAEAALVAGARVEPAGGEAGIPAVTNAAGGAPGSLEFSFPSPYVYTGGAVAATVSCAEPGDSAALLMRIDGSGRAAWVKVAEHSGPGRAELKADLGAPGASCAAGWYGFALRLELRSARPGGARLEKLRVERWAQLNAGALPAVLPGWNRYSLRAEAATGWAPRVTLEWEGRDGREFESRASAQLPCDFQIFGARRKLQEPPILMRRILLECVRAPEAAVEAARGAAGVTESETAERLLAVARAGGAGALDKLRAELGGQDPVARQWAVHAMAVLGDKSAVPDMARALASDPCEKVRLVAANALGILRDPEGVPALIAALDEKAYAGLDKASALPFGLRPTRWAAARALGEIGDPRAVEPLLAEMARARSDYFDVLVEALVALQARQALPALCRQLLQNPRSGNARACAEAIGRLADPADPGQDAVDALVATLTRGRDLSARRAAIVSLGQLRAKVAAKQLEAIARDPAADPYLREPARQALSAIGER